MANNWVQLIRSLAPQYGVDPQAALAVASTEGLSGGVGDQGHAFGPFQLNDAGGVLTGRAGNHRAFAESPQGIKWAIQQIAKVAKGKRGKQAVMDIVSGFERPADPTSEIRNATNALAKFRPGPRGGGASMDPGFLATPQQTKEITDRMPILSGAFDKSHDAGFVGALNDLGARARKTTRGTQTGQHPDAPVHTQRGASRPISGKIIGTPHHGTHTLGNWESDNAVDVAMPVGTPIYAPMAGTIGQQFGQMGAKGSRFEGIRMHLLSPQDELYLAHLSRVAKGIAPGAHVTQGQLLGYSGSASGVGHLHLGARNDDAASYVNR